jgi:hypothetical protein
LSIFWKSDKIKLNSGGAPVSLARKIAAAKKEAAESEGGPRRRNFVSLRGKQKFLLFACPVASRRLCYGARPSGKVFVPAELRSAIKFRSPDFRQKKFGFRPTNTTRRNLLTLRNRKSIFCTVI